MKPQPYGMVCPITHACEMLEPRWTMPILAELWGGSTRFNEIKRGVGNISTALLSKRLKELQKKGLIERIEDPDTKNAIYVRTQMAIDLEPAMDALGKWAQRNIEARTALANADVSSMMWHMRNLIHVDELPDRQVVIRFRFSDPELEYNTYWALVRPGKPVEICTDIPNFDVDLYIETDQTTLSCIMLSRTTIPREVERGTLFLSGDRELSNTMDRWLYHRTKETRDEILQLA